MHAIENRYMCREWPIFRYIRQTNLARLDGGISKIEPPLDLSRKNDLTLSRRDPDVREVLRARVDVDSVLAKPRSLPVDLKLIPFLPLALLVVAAHPSCLTLHKVTGWSTGGEAHVSYPQVFKRERLLIDRWREYEHLRKKLDQPFTSSVQAYHDLRVLTEVFTQLSLDAKPRDLARLQREIEITRAKIQLQELENDLGEAKKGEDVSGSFQAQVTISGTLKEKKDSSPLQSRSISFSGPGLAETMTARTKSDGSYSTILRLKGSKASVEAVVEDSNQDAAPSYEFTIDIATSGNTVTPTIAGRCGDRFADDCISKTAQATLYPAQTASREQSPERARAISQLEKLTNQMRAYLDTLQIPDAKDVIKSEAKLSAVDQLNDERAYRAAILSAMNENQLDDSHDIFGSTLYTLEMKASLTPGEYSTNLADIELQIENGEEAEGEINDLYTKWLDQFRHVVQGEISRLIGDLRNPVMKETRRKFCLEWRGRNVFTELESMDFIGQFPRRSPCENDVVEPSDFAVSALVLTRYRALKNMFRLKIDEGRLDVGDVGEEEKLERICTIPIFRENDSVPRRVRIDSDTPASAGQTLKQFADAINETLRSDSGRAGLQARLDNPELRAAIENGRFKGEVECKMTNRAFRAAMRKIESSFKPRVVGVQPREYSQNISDVSARDAVRALVLGMNGGLKGGVDVEAAMTFLDRSQERTQAILRQPLISSYGSGESRFGWILGPKYRIASDGKPEFVHSPVTHSVTFSLMVPAWKKSVRIHAKRYWVDAEGDRNCGASAWDNRRGLEGTEARWYHYAFFPWFALKSTVQRGVEQALTCSVGLTDEPVTVNLPADMSAITTALLFSEGLTRQPPAIEEPRNGHFQLIARNPGSNTAVPRQSILIPGKELWRNPEVFVGNQRADRVEIAPDMQGIVATFENLEYSGNAADLRVITSVGKDTLQEAVSITRPDAGSTPKKPLGNLRVDGSPYCVSSCRFKVDIQDPAALLGAALKLRLVPAPDGSAGKDYDAEPFRAGDLSAVFHVNEKAVTAPRLMSGRVLVANGSLTYEADQRFLFLSSPSQAGFEIKDATLKFKDGEKAETLSGQVKLFYYQSAFSWLHPGVDPTRLKLRVQNVLLSLKTCPAETGTGRHCLFVSGLDILTALKTVKALVGSPLSIQLEGGFPISGGTVQIDREP